MTTIRIASRRKFATIDREPINDARLTFRARGILTWLLDKPDDWEANSDAIARNTPEGRDAVRTAMRELKDCGYLVYEKLQIDGKWITTVTVHEISTKPQVGPKTDYQASVFRASVSQAVIPCTDTKTDNKEISTGHYQMPGPRPFCEKCEKWTDGEGPKELQCLCLRSVG